jgi:hypothetical protein
MSANPIFSSEFTSERGRLRRLLPLERATHLHYGYGV